MIARLRKHYGSTPLHVVAHIAMFALAALVILQLYDVRRADNVLLWFVGALVLHDFLLLPFYSVLDRVGARIARPRRAVNAVRVPLALSGLMLLLFFPPMFGRNDGSFSRVSGVEPEGYLERWLIFTAVAFAVAGLVVVLRSARGRAPQTSSS